MNTILSVKDISYSVKDNRLFNSENHEISILQGINFELNRGNILGIAGESGSGKTTLAKIIAGLITPTKGLVRLNTLKSYLKKNTSPIQILFQNNGEILNPFREVDKVIEEAIKISNDSNDIIEEQKIAIYNSVNIAVEDRNKKGFQLSGGVQQRAALARLLATSPELLILDEPFSAQDPESQLNLMNLLKRINSESGITMICIAHNLQILRKLCTDLLIMYQGTIVESGSVEKIFNSPEHHYTKFLIRAGNYNLSSSEIRYEKELHKIE